MIWRSKLSSSCRKAVAQFAEKSDCYFIFLRKKWEKFVLKSQKGIAFFYIYIYN